MTWLAAWNRSSSAASSITPRRNLVNLKRLLVDVAAPGRSRSSRYHTRERNDAHRDRPLDDTILQDANDAINHGQPLSLNYKIRNIHRSAVTKVSGEIAYQSGIDGLADDLLELNSNGTAGQSFGAFLTRGLRVVLNGEANDYVAKGMSGGTLIVPSLPCGESLLPTKTASSAYLLVRRERRRILRQWPGPANASRVRNSARPPWSRALVTTAANT